MQNEINSIRIRLAQLESDKRVGKISETDFIDLIDHLEHEIRLIEEDLWQSRNGTQTQS